MQLHLYLGICCTLHHHDKLEPCSHWDQQIPWTGTWQCQYYNVI